MFARTLLVKRPAFRHEREIRLLLFQQDESKIRDDLFPYPIHPNALIDQVMIDPRVSAEDARELRAHIAQQTGFQGHRR
jgi:hypothetical protein